MLKLDVLAAELNLWANETEQIYRATKEIKYRRDTTHLRYLAATLNQSSLPSTGVTSFNTRVGDVVLSSLDVTTALGYNPVTQARTLTINGVTYDLSANRSWTISTATPTLAQVTTAGNTTTNAITVGGLTVATNLIYTDTVNGRVGIGTTSPAVGLDVRNGFNLWVSTGHYLEGVAASGTDASVVFRRAANNGWVRYALGVNGSVSFGANISTGEVQLMLPFGGFFQTFYANGSEAMRIPTTRNVLIGTTTDAGYKLDVNGTARFSNDIRISTSSGATIFLGVDVNNTVRVTDTYAKFQIQKTSIGGAISINGGGQAGTTYTLTDTGHAFSLGSNNTTADAITITRPFRGNVVATTKTILNISTSNETALSNATLLRGIYFNPTVTDWTSIRAIETTAGDLIFNTQSAASSAGYTTMAIGGSSGVYFQMYVGPSPTSQNLRGQIWAVGNNLIFNNPSTGYLGLYTTLYSGVTVWPTTGNVYVGASPSTDTGFKLDVVGTTRVQGDTTIGLGTTGVINNLTFQSARGGAGLRAGIYWSSGASIINRRKFSGGNDNTLSFSVGISPIELLTIQEHNGTTTTNNIGVNNTNPNISAVLDIASTTQGFLQPRMTNTQVLAITTPATGLQAYDTTNNKNLLYNGTAWQNIATESWVTGQGYITSQPWTVSGSDIYYNTGNVGIGTASPLYKLHVSGTAGDIVYILASTGQSAVIGATGSGTNRMYIGYSPGAENISITSSGVVRLNSITSGNVLIGTTTDAGYKLDVDGTFRATGIVYADSTINQPTVFGNKLLFMNSGNYSKIALADGTNWSMDYHSGTTIADVGYHRFYTGSTSGWVERLRIDNNGNVGIGTPTPTELLHIVNNTTGNKFARISAGAADASAAWVAQNDQVDNVVYRVFGSAVTGSQMGISLARSASLLANLGGSGKFLVGTFSSTDFVMGTGNQERIRLVDSTGNFLIGTTTDNGNKLQVSGSIDSTGYSINNIAGYTGLLMIPGNPPGMQNVDIQGGIIVNVF